MSAPIVINQIAAAAFLVLVLTAAINDLRTYRIPNALTLAIVFIYPIFALTSPAEFDWLAVLLIAVAVFAVGFVLFAFGQIGGGDVKLLVGCALWAGPAFIFDFLVVTALAGGAYHSLALDGNGNVWAWGANEYGQLGDGTLCWWTRPVQVVGLTDAISGLIFLGAIICARRSMLILYLVPPRKHYDFYLIL